MEDFDWTGWTDWTPLATLNLKTVPIGSGAYVIATDKPICRAIGTDPFGFLDVGESDGLRTRLRNFLRCLNERGEEGHMAAWRFAFFRFDRHFPVTSLRVRWTITQDKATAYALEGRILLEYIKAHCELPPLNYKFNWNEYEAMKVFFEALGANKYGPMMRTQRHVESLTTPSIRKDQVTTVLTHMHVQYLVGLCCLRASPEAVELTLGDRVHDRASMSDRDVDVTVTFGQTTVAGYSGYEVKDEKTPMSVDKVEQLCVKLNDMPSLTNRAVVSASGFSETGIAKARAHGIDLYEFRNWEPPIEVDANANGMRETLSTLAKLTPIALNSKFNHDVEERAALVATLRTNPPVLNRDGTPHAKYLNFNILFPAVVEIALHQFTLTEQGRMPPPGPCSDPRKIPDGPMGPPFDLPSLVVQLAEEVHISVEGKITRLYDVLLWGSVQWFQEQQKVEHKVMVNLADGTYYAGAAIAKAVGESMMALVFSFKDTLASLCIINLTEKQKNLLNQLKIRP